MLTGNFKIDLIIIGVLLLIAFCLWCFVRINYIPDYKKQNKTAVLFDEENIKLSDLENVSLERLLQAFEEDGVNIASKENMEQYEEV
jgi:hypothetical protein